MATVAGPETPAQVAEAILAAFLTHDSDRILEYTHPVDYMEIEDGLLRHNTIFWDGASFARSIRLLPAQGSLGDRALIGMFNARAKLRGLLRRRPSS